jgi:hypothetical protein
MAAAGQRLDHYRLRAANPNLVWTGWIDSVRFISLLTVIGLGSLSAWQSARVEVKQDGES